ncbi:hypothetical protein F5Y18DRAFT_244778 [Xylariaceae sp. FL1019]|nr:hypothetical protein F5Y18DRAFT_244778 [Xylariaceae sp. FL1019]
MLANCSAPTSSPGPDPNAATVRSHRRRSRRPISCEPCRRSKLRCNRQTPCNSCQRRSCGHACVYENNARDGRMLPQHVANSVREPEMPDHPSSRIHNENTGTIATTSQSLSPITTPTGSEEHSSAGALTHGHWEEVLRRPMGYNEPSTLNPRSVESPRPPFSSLLFSLNDNVSIHDFLAMMPPPDCCEFLVSRFFLNHSPFFHILHGPTFQREYNAFVDNREAVDLSWLALVFAIIFIGLKSLQYDHSTLDDMWPGRSQSQDWNAVAAQFLEGAMSCLSKTQFMTSYRLSSLQALLLIAYAIGHSEGVERAWTLLGIALNIAIALQCNSESAPSGLSRIEVERRRRCWAGLLSLYTYQAVSFPGLDLIFLSDDKMVMPADVNDTDISESGVSGRSSPRTQMTVMMEKIRLFQLSTKICRYLRGNEKYDEGTRDRFDSEIAEEQHKWDIAYLIDQRPSFLDVTSYTFWAFLQMHAHHLRLLIHQPFCRNRSHSVGFCQQSRSKCIESGAILVDLHRQLWECPRLRPFRWTLDGLMSFYALHGAVAMASCLLEDDPITVESRLQYRAAFSSVVIRIDVLQIRSAICQKAYPILKHLQTLLYPTHTANPVNTLLMDTFDTWVDNQQWLNSGSIDWSIFDGILSEADAP